MAKQQLVLCGYILAMVVLVGEELKKGWRGVEEGLSGFIPKQSLRRPSPSLNQPAAVYYGYTNDLPVNSENILG
ncbi:hypothetical protein [Pedobacter gandavensis]|uniref:hypothetical protein n=1 Tax=Pedobacter gandavensis TaxID=2679963 RepID=UPI00292F5B9D|nr:hypothetical protein [Pedobacter gandavensis]